MEKLKTFLDSLSAEELAQRLDLAIEGAGLGIWDWDLRDNSVNFDRRWCEMLGLAQEETEMVLTTWESRVHPDDIEDCYKDIKAYMNGEVPYYENIHRMKHANGDWVYILDRGRFSGWDEKRQPIRFTGTHFDVTTSEKAKRLLERHRENTKKMIEGIPTPVAMFDRERRYLAASTRWIAQYHLNNSDILGRTVDELHPDFPKKWFLYFDQALDGKINGSEKDLYQHESGERQWLRWQILPWEGSEGRPAGFIMMSEDITDRVESEIRLNQSAKLAALGEMAGGIAHEINNPLAIIKALCGSLLQRGETMDENAVNQNVERIDQTVDRMSRIVKSMQKILRDEGPEVGAVCDARDVVKETLALSTERFEINKVELRSYMESESFLVKMRYSELSQVLINLVNNAYYQVKGCTPSWIHIELKKEGDFIRLSVMDSGQGIDEDVQNRIFEPFFTTKEVGDGIGLGLSVSKSLVENSGGRLSLEDSCQNTRFDVILKSAEV